MCLLFLEFFLVSENEEGCVLVGDLREDGVCIIVLFEFCWGRLGVKEGNCSYVLVLRIFIIRVFFVIVVGFFYSIGNWSLMVCF